MKKMLTIILIPIILILFLTATAFSIPTVELVNPNTPTDITSGHRIDFNAWDTEAGSELNLTARIIADEDNDSENGVYKTLETIDLDDEAYCEDHDSNPRTANECKYYLYDEIEGEYFLGIIIENESEDTDSDYSNGKMEFDTIGPEISDFSPEPDTYKAQFNPWISAKIIDEGSGMDYGSIVFEVAGLKYKYRDSETSYDFTKKRAYFLSSDELPEKTVRVKITAQDEAGNESEAEWSFTKKTSQYDSDNDSDPSYSDADETGNPFELSFEANKVYVGKGETLGVQMHFRNNSWKTLKLDYWIEAEEGLNAWLDSEWNTLELNPNESTYRTATVKNNGFDDETEKEIKIHYRANSELKTKTLKVSNEKPIRVELKTNKIEIGKLRDYVEIELENKDASNAFYKLRAYGNESMPFFSVPEIYLEKDSNRTVKLYLQSNEFTELKEYSVMVEIVKDNFVQKEEFNIEWVKWKVYPLEIKALEKFTIQKSSEKTVKAVLKNNYSEPMQLQVACKGSVECTPLQKNISLNAFGEKEIELKIKTAKDSPKGEQILTVYAFNYLVEAEKDFNAVVGEGRGIDFSMDKEREISMGKRALFYLTIKNFGDCNETVLLNVSNVKGMNSEYPAEVLVEKGKEKTVEILFTPKESQFPIDELFSVQLSNNRTTQYLYGTLSVKGKEIIGFESFPIEVEFNAGKESALAVLLYNPLETDVRGLTLEVKGLPHGYNAEKIEGISLKANGKKLVELNVSVPENAKEEELTLEFHLTGQNLESKKAFKANASNSSTGNITGFAMLGESFGYGLVFILAILVLFVLLRYRESSGKTPRRMIYNTNEHIKVVDTKKSKEINTQSY